MGFIESILDESVLSSSIEPYMRLLVAVLIYKTELHRPYALKTNKKCWLLFDLLSVSYFFQNKVKYNEES